MSLESECLSVAALSPCGNRKVGCLLVGRDDQILATGYNYSPTGLPCEDAAGATESHVVHAEAHAVHNYINRYGHLEDEHQPYVQTIYVTHNPCASCLAVVSTTFDYVIDLVIVGSFMKFDSDKLRYDLIPAEWHTGDAEVLTGGAKKYKPNNWKEVDDLGRYLAALERHLTEFKQYIETKDDKFLRDDDTGLHHMKHLRTNAGFLLTLTEKK